MRQGARKDWAEVQGAFPFEFTRMTLVLNRFTDAVSALRSHFPRAQFMLLFSGYGTNLGQSSHPYTLPTSYIVAKNRGPLVRGYASDP